MLKSSEKNSGHWGRDENVSDAERSNGGKEYILLLMKYEVLKYWYGRVFRRLIKIIKK